MRLCHHPHNMKHSQPCSQGFVDCNKLEIEVVFSLYLTTQFVKLLDTEGAGGEPRNGSL